MENSTRFNKMSGAELRVVCPSKGKSRFLAFPCSINNNSISSKTSKIDPVNFHSRYLNLLEPLRTIRREGDKANLESGFSSLPYPHTTSFSDYLKIHNDWRNKHKTRRIRTKRRGMHYWNWISNRQENRTRNSINFLNLTRIITVKVNPLSYQEFSIQMLRL